MGSSTVPKLPSKTSIDGKNGADASTHAAYGRKARPATDQPNVTATTAVTITVRVLLANTPAAAAVRAYMVKLDGSRAVEATKRPLDTQTRARKVLARDGPYLLRTALHRHGRKHQSLADCNQAGACDLKATGKLCDAGGPHL